MLGLILFDFLLNKGPKNTKIKIANFTRVVKVTFGPLEKGPPPHYEQKKNFVEVGHVIHHWNRLDEYNKKPNRNICPKIDILAGNGQKVPLRQKSAPYWYKNAIFFPFPHLSVMFLDAI